MACPRKGGNVIKSILIPVDATHTSEYVLNAGLNIAELSNATVKVLYVEDMMRLLEWQPVELMAAALTTSSNLPHGKPTLEQLEVEKEFVKESDYLRELYEASFSEAALEKYFLTKRGRVDEEIINLSKTVDFIIIGKRSSKTFPHGSKEPGPVTENLLRHTTKPVLVVPPHSKLNRQILIGYDGSKTAQRALSLGAEMAILLGAKIIVVSVGDDIDRASPPLDDAKEFLKPYHLDVDYIVDFDSNKPWEPILIEAKNFDVGLIVIGAYGESRLFELIFGSTTREVLKGSHCPVLLCR